MSQIEDMAGNLHKVNNLPNPQSAAHIGCLLICSACRLTGGVSKRVASTLLISIHYAISVQCQFCLKYTSLFDVTPSESLAVHTQCRGQPHGRNRDA